MANNSLKIFDIERFAIHDGHGIRTVVYLQGCPLRCPWCANPESHTMGKKLFYFSNKCTSCKVCITSCPTGAISHDNDKIKIDRDSCTACGGCTKSCLAGAFKISGSEMKIDDILTVVMKDKNYYQNSGGGLTISGGEPFLQFSGLMSLLEKGKAFGLHIAVETCGQFKLSQLKEAVPYIDVFLFDIKHANQEKLKSFDGDKKIIMNNLYYIQRVSSGKIILTVPVIPGFNNEEDFIMEVGKIAKGCEAVEVHLLPYHRLGQGKYDQLGLKCDFNSKETIEETVLESYKKIIECSGVRVKIGG